MNQSIKNPRGFEKGTPQMFRRHKGMESDSSLGQIVAATW